jgi:hypothetical protein
LVSAQAELAAIQKRRTIATLYEQGLRYIKSEEWSQALERLEEVQRLELGYRETERLLSQVRRKVAKPQTVEVPNLSGQNVHQASSTLNNRGLKLSARYEFLSDAAPSDEVIGQTPEAGTEVEGGSSVIVTVSSGQSMAEVSDITAQSPFPARPDSLPGEVRTKPDSLPGEVRPKLDRPQSLPQDL